MATTDPNAPLNFKQRLHNIIFHANTPVGKAFDVVLLLAILLSVAVVMLESVRSFSSQYHRVLVAAEWALTLIFTVEYILRLYCSPNRFRYSTSFFGLIDLLSILPTYAALFFPDAHYFMIIRVLRLLRVFRIFKLIRYVNGAQVLISALRASSAKITVFLGAVVTIIIVVGALMHLIEGEEHGFTSIPRGVYWAVVTLTTVGYGDITPQTHLGQFVASIVMIMGYGIIAVPTGIVSVELHQAARDSSAKRNCPSCTKTGHELNARFCNHCGSNLSP